MKIIFLDINGVMSGWEDRANAGMFGKNQIRNLNHLVEETGAVVVITSTMRHCYKIEDMREFFKMSGFNGIIHDYTTTKFQNINSKLEDVLIYLDENVVDKFVIFDDLCSFEGLDENFIEVNSRYGLTENDVDKAIHILNE